MSDSSILLFFRSLIASKAYCTMRMNAIVKMKKLILTFAVVQFLVLATGVYYVLERLVDVDHWFQAGGISKWTIT